MSEPQWTVSFLWWPQNKGAFSFLVNANKTSFPDIQNPITSFKDGCSYVYLTPSLENLYTKYITRSSWVPTAGTVIWAVIIMISTASSTIRTITHNHSSLFNGFLSKCSVHPALPVELTIQAALSARSLFDSFLLQSKPYTFHNNLSTKNGISRSHS